MRSARHPRPLFTDGPLEGRRAVTLLAVVWWLRLGSESRVPAPWTLPVYGCWLALHLAMFGLYMAALRRSYRREMAALDAEIAQAEARVLDLLATAGRRGAG